MSYAFTFDASACSGCKACQEACRDKNDLPGGMLWRWVIEVAGGEWQQVGGAWQNSVFAYNLSLACNHCVHPKCAGVCPVDAFHVRPDGIVLINAGKCMGCGYCAWACPYGAPQYLPERGVMTKCNFCYDSLDAGLPPSCVAACPLRALDFATVDATAPAPAFAPASIPGSTPTPAPANRLSLWQLPASDHPFPLPPYSRTEPHLAIQPHPAMANPLAKQVANREEIQPRLVAQRRALPARDELPLVGFTLLAQMAAGMAVCALALPQIPLPLLLSIGLLLGAAGLISFLHLGHKRNAWRAVVHQRKSWLSREILAAGLFGLAWAAAAGLAWLHPAPPSWLRALLALLGLALIFSMAQVYRLRAVPAWNTWRTPLSFFLSAAILGALGANLASPAPGWALVAGLGMVAELGLALTAHRQANTPAAGLRMGLLCAGLVGAVLVVPYAGLAIPLLLLALAEQIIGRWQFYAARSVSRY